jgi:hypothetical protein
MRTVEVLFFDGCPNVERALERVRAAIASTRVDDVSVRLVKVETEETAREVGFLGSPSVRVDGVDVEASARARSDFALTCRVYQQGERLDGAPPVDWIRAALVGDAAADPPSTPAPAHDCCVARVSRIAGR